MKKTTAYLLLLFILISLHTNAQTIHYVTTTGSGDGSSWGNASADLQAIIDNSSAGDTIWIAAGTYAPTGVAFAMKNGVVLLGGFDGTETTAAMRNWRTNVSALTNNGSNAAMINNSLDSTAVLDGIWFNDVDNWSYDLACIQNISSSPTIRNCLFNHNSTFSSSGAIDMENDNGSSPKITNCLFADGYGIIGYSPSILNNSSSAVFTNCVFNNIVGGAITNQTSSSVTVINCTFNAASIASYGSSYSITNCVLGHYSFFSANNDVAGNVTYSYMPSSIPGTGNVEIDYSIDPFVNSANPIGDDLIWMTADDGLKLANNYRDVGTPDTTGLQLPATDITGTARIKNNRIDMGAYESALSAVTYYVDNTVTGGNNNGSSWANAFLKLEDAIAIANNGDSIFVAKGTYNVPVGGSFVMKEGLKIYGGFAGTESNLAQRILTPMADNGSILDGNNTARVIDNYQNGLTAAAILDGFTITHGSAFQGGGISNNAVSPTFNNLYIVNNVANGTPNDGGGGGIYNENASPVITNTVISNNTVDNWDGNSPRGGGIANYVTSAPHLKNVLINNNTPDGIFSNIYTPDFSQFGTPSLYLDSVTINENTAIGIEFSGTDNSVFTMDHSIVSKNTGGLSVTVGTDATSTIAHSTITENTTTLDGGGINFSGQSKDGLIIDHCTISKNTGNEGGAINAGGGAINPLDGSSYNLITMTNSVVSENTGNGDIISTGGMPGKFVNTLMIKNSGSSLLSAQAGGTVINSTISDNICSGTLSNTSQIEYYFTNSIIFGNAAPNNGMMRYSHCITQYERNGDSVWNVNPLFVGNGDYHLQSYSPAINAGTVDTTGLGIPTVDLDESPRIVQNRIDIGAYENTAIIQPTNGIVYVKKGGAGNFSGDSWANASPEVAYALQFATSHTDNIQQIWVAGGIYNPLYTAGDGTTDADKSFVLVDSLSVYGGFAGNETDISQRDLSNAANASILSGDINNDDNGGFFNTNDNVEIAIISPGNNNSAVLDGFTIKGGNSNQSASGYVNTLQVFKNSGGGIYLNESSPTLNNLTITNNSATESGGGIFAYSSSPILNNLTITGNRASNGGGMYNDGSSPVLNNVTISSDTALPNGPNTGCGGGMYNNNSSPQLTNVMISDNITHSNGENTGNGAGMYNSNSSPQLTGVTINGNTAMDGGSINESFGGGVYNSNSTPVFNNTFITNNTARNIGGVYNVTNSVAVFRDVQITGNDPAGISNSGAGTSSVLINVTLADNIGAGIINASSNPVIKNSIIYGNTVAGISNAHGAKPVISYSVVQGSGGSNSWSSSTGTDGGNNLDIDPMFTGSGNYILQGSSAAIDAGTTDTTGLDLSAVDLANNPRILNDRIDIGAYEFMSVLPVALVNFTGNALSNQTAQLNWQTATEINTSYFVIERSADAKNFTAIGTVNAIGVGNNNYAYNDGAPLQAGYYRLRIVDKNGTAKYSRVVFISFSTFAASITIFPNPATGFVTVVTNNKTLVGTIAILYDLNGQILQRMQLGNSSTVVPLNELASGTYLLHVQTGETFKVMVK
ncbi:beta strand repeat-containing protein [Ferruginibacter albus]|uniref:beta strand repeat-containing protein n=1 Tax=Ferruginibacter albus TaxID=2875540 RepID=UPI001CC40926|nr:T9SS type A sorting domain-containing protein [Ferruginibacter albus]UAY53162.1 T9SS type A sorting domain-containing protein [Ferruginibacter albus]